MNPAWTWSRITDEQLGVDRSENLSDVFEKPFFFCPGNLSRTSQEEEESKTELMRYKQQLELTKQQMMLAGLSVYQDKMWLFVFHVESQRKMLFIKQHDVVLLCLLTGERERRKDELLVLQKSKQERTDAELTHLRLVRSPRGVTSHQIFFARSCPRVRLACLYASKVSRVERCSLRAVVCGSVVAIRASAARRQPSAPQSGDSQAPARQAKVRSRDLSCVFSKFALS